MKLLNHASGVSHSTVPTFALEIATSVRGKFKQGDAMHFNVFLQHVLRQALKKLLKEKTS
jgi:hypothetical protein